MVIGKLQAANIQLPITNYTLLMNPAVTILGVPIHDVTMNEACEHAERLILAGGAHQFATVNPEFVMAAQRDSGFMKALQHTTLNVPDGAGILWAAGRRRRPLRERVPGIELMVNLCGIASAHQWRVYFLGAAPGVAGRAAAALALQFPGLMVAGTHAGSPAEAEAPAIVERIRAARPHMLFVAYGAPAQDTWLARHLPLCSDAGAAGFGAGLVGMGVGGAFDMAAGLQKRAPEWMRDANLEWLYRLIRQPWRIKRQSALLRYVAAAMLESR
jgi:N-acetylglucosaminyldiphosphoundecaprenol N-acetyl-beta-D-mannosaminyltransferase